MGSRRSDGIALFRWDCAPGCRDRCGPLNVRGPDRAVPPPQRAGQLGVGVPPRGSYRTVGVPPRGCHRVVVVGPLWRHCVVGTPPGRYDRTVGMPRCRCHCLGHGRLDLQFTQPLQDDAYSSIGTGGGSPTPRALHGSQSSSQYSGVPMSPSVVRCSLTCPLLLIQQTSVPAQGPPSMQWTAPVSYTHLTLPTIYSV